MTDLIFEASKARTNAQVATFFATFAVVLSAVSACASIYAFNKLTDTSLTDNFNSIALGISVLQTILALGAFGGFFLIRGAAKDSAREAAAECSPECTDRWLSNNMEARLVNYFSGEDGRSLLDDIIRDIETRNEIAGNNNGMEDLV